MYVTQPEEERGASAVLRKFRDRIVIPGMLGKGLVRIVEMFGFNRQVWFCLPFGLSLGVGGTAPPAQEAAWSSSV